MKCLYYLIYQAIRFTRTYISVWKTLNGYEQGNMWFVDFKLGTFLESAVKNIHDWVYRLPESLSMRLTQWPRAALLQQPARVADSIPRMSYSSGSQASNTERNKEPSSPICHKPWQILQYWASTYACITTIVSHIVHCSVQLFCFSVLRSWFLWRRQVSKESGRLGDYKAWKQMDGFLMNR